MLHIAVQSVLSVKQRRTSWGASLATGSYKHIPQNQNLAVDVFYHLERVYETPYY